MKIKRDLYRITANLPTNLVEMIDEFANANGISRTTAITILCIQALQGEMRKE